MSSLKALVRNTISRLKPIWTQCNEFVLAIQSEPVRRHDGLASSGGSWWRGEPSERARHDDNFHYATIDYWNVRKVVRALKPGSEDVFYYIGSGVGRIVCAGASKRLRKCIGAELSEPLCQIARRNAMKLWGRKAPIEIVCGDASTADLGEGMIYFMFNPFGADTMGDTLENIMKPECLMCSNNFWLLAKLFGQGHRKPPTGPGAGK